MLNHVFLLAADDHRDIFKTSQLFRVDMGCEKILKADLFFFNNCTQPLILPFTPSTVQLGIGPDKEILFA